MESPTGSLTASLKQQSRWRGGGGGVDGSHDGGRRLLCAGPRHA